MAQQTKLEIRSAIKKRKPTYRRRQSNQFAKLAKNAAWRRPKGMGNKSRRNRRGHIGMLQVGYGSPKEVKGTNKNGLFEVVISNIKDLESVDTSIQVPILSRTMGKKKKVDVLKVAAKKSIAIGNVKDVSKAIKEIELDLEEKKKSNKATKNVKNTSENKSTQEKKSDEKKESNTPDNVGDKEKVSKKTTTTTTTTTTKKMSAKSSSNVKSEEKEVSKK